MFFKNIFAVKIRQDVYQNDLKIIVAFSFNETKTLAVISMIFEKFAVGLRFNI